MGEGGVIWRSAKSVPFLHLFFYKVLSQEILEAEDFLSHNMFLLKLPDFYINVNPLYGQSWIAKIAVNWQFMIDPYGLQHLCRNLYPSNFGSTKPIFWKYEWKCLNKVCLRHFLEDSKSQFCHAAAKKCCGSGNLLIWVIRTRMGKKFDKCHFH